MKRFPVLMLFLIGSGLLWYAFSYTSNSSEAPKFNTNHQPKKPSVMVKAVNAVLESLTPEQRKKASFEFTDEERYNWHFTVKSRNGLPWEEFNDQQRKKMVALLQLVLSDQGYKKGREIMALESILSELEGREPGNRYRHPELYYFSVFGTPSDQNPWGWRFEGHHISLNFSSVDQSLAVTPAFMGANPAEVPSGPEKGKRVLKAEEDMARQLMAAFSDSQLELVIFSKNAPREIVTGVDRKINLQCCKGISYGQMTTDQQKLLRQLLELYLNNMEADIAQREWEKISAVGLDQIHFAWAGSLERGKGHYYRIQNPNFLLEYDCTQNNANHIHTVWRNTENDFGEDLLQQHYSKHKHD